MKGKRYLLIAGIVMGLATTGAYAQQSQNQSQPTHAAASKAQAPIPHAQLQAFVDVQKDIRQIRGKYQGQVKSASSKKKKRAIEMKAEREMVQAIKKKGLSVRDYNKIARAYQSNAKVRKKINKMAKM